MTRALFRKQMMEVFAWIYRDRKSGKNRSVKGIVMYSALYLFLFAFLGVIFYMMAGTLCKPLTEAGFGWLFFALMGLIAVALGVFGSVFNTYASLYQAKDNDFLLSMPIPPRTILAARLFGVFAMGLMYELIVMIPTLMVYFINVPVNVIGAIFSLLTPLVLAVLVLTLSCILGWVVALVSSRLKNKSIITVLMSLVFIAVYYYFCAQAYSLLQAIILNPKRVGDAIRGVLFPFYHMGLAAEGNVLSMLIFTGVIAAIFGAVYLVLSRSFIRLATTNRGAAKKKYMERTLRKGSVDGAMLRKELRRFLSSPTYMLNCSLGTVFMLAAAVVLLIKGARIQSAVGVMLMGYEGLLPLIAMAIVCMLVCMNDITAPSVSLEGKNLWLVQSLPVTAWQALRAKLRLHLLMTLAPALALTVCLEVVIRPEPVFAILMPVVTALFVLFMALLGLTLNLKMPNLKWTDETVPLKQSMGVMLALFGGWAIVVGFGAAYAALRNAVSEQVFLLCIAVLLAILSAALLRWVKTRGADIFSAL